jgi:hypothetical protein
MVGGRAKSVKKAVRGKERRSSVWDRKIMAVTVGSREEGSGGEMEEGNEMDSLMKEEESARWTRKESDCGLRVESISNPTPPNPR